MAGMVDQMISLYGADVTEDGVSLNQAAEKPWEVWQAMQRQYLQAFPEIVGIRSSMGDFNERYQIWRGHGPESSSLGATGGMRRFVEKAREVVVGELGRELVVSAWGNPPEEYPLNQPRGVREIFRGIDGSDSVSLLLNECEHDFYLNSPLNDNFGVGDVRKGVMFQVQREYQGMGEIPVYVGPRIAQRFTQCARYGDTEIAAARLWWSRNLYTSPVCWTWWNLYAWQRACWEPDGDPWEWARDWNRMTFGPAGAEELADALMMTEELAARTFYVPGYNGAKRDAYAITHRNTFTDGRHYWRVTPDPQGEAFRDNHVAGRVPLHMAQIEETRRLSGRVLEAARVATERMSDDEQARVVMESFEHFHALVPILTHYQQALLLKHYLDEPWHSVERRAELRAECVEHSRAALAAFDTYRARHDLYQDSGMVPLLRSYLREFGEPVPPPIEAVETFDIVWREDPPRDGEWPEPCHVLNAERISDSSMDINEAPHEPDPADVAYEAAPRVVASPAGLHVRIDVIGAWPPMPIRAGRIYRCGTIALNLDTNHDERGDATYYLIRDEDSGEPRLMTVMRDMRQRSLNYDELDGEVDAGCAVSLDTTDAGYRWECTIPWTMLGGFDPSAGVPLGVCWETHDAPPRPGVPWVRLRHPVVPAWRNTPPLVFAYGSIQR